MVLSGFGAMVVEARPGDTLYGLHAMVFNEPRVKDDQIALSAKADLAKVEELISQGQWSQAQNQLAQVSTSVQGLNDGGRRQDLIDEVNLLNTRVESRNPNATLPPQAPTVGNSVTRPAPRSRPAGPAPSSASPSSSAPVSPTPSTSARLRPRPRRRPRRLRRRRRRRRRGSVSRDPAASAHLDSDAPPWAPFRHATAATAARTRVGHGCIGAGASALTRGGGAQWRRKPSASDVASFSEASA